ncbi:MAG TPA: DUF1080 domain-containing protein [Cyclobacteriaceae bacterium]|nr:DUF1080 domain-containing protein [Cyclobacteriaceae bacterium]
MIQKKIASAAFLLVAALLLFNTSSAQQFKQLFNGKDFKGWYTFVDGYGKNSDPLKIFQVQPDGVLHISGEKFGYLCTEGEFENFHLKLEFKFGEKKWAPRLDQVRDSGVLYFIPMNDEDRIWPSGIECQIQEGDVGDFWMIGKTTIVIDGQRTQPGDYVRSKKKKDAERPHGEWNTVEVIVKDGHCTHIVNGVQVSEGSDPSVRKGKLLIQSEGAEIFYRNITLQSL